MKVLYEHHPNLGAAQIIVYRSALAVLFLLCYHGTNLKLLMYDTIDKDSLPALTSRMVSGNIGIFIIIMSVKYFPLTTLAMIINCAPIVSTFLALPVLGEKLTITKILTLFVAFGGISLMILGGEEESKLPAYTPTPIIYFAVVIHPFFLAASNLAMRAARKLADSIVTFYMALSLLIVFLLFGLASGVDFWYFYNFSLIDFGCILVIAVGTICAQTLKFMALKNHTVGGLEPYNFIQPIQ
jgi:drug/metabolite transporter (DMT)-like permease